MDDTSAARKPWSQEDDDWLRANLHLSTAEQAAALGRTERAVMSRRVALHLRNQYRAARADEVRHKRRESRKHASREPWWADRPWTDGDDATLIKMRDAPLKDVAALLERDTLAVSSRRRHLNIQHPSQQSRRGEIVRQHAAYLLREAGYTLDEIAEALGFSSGTSAARSIATYRKANSHD